jgi:hypothetical protein
MQNTANYKFKKPENTDLYNVQDFSDNMDAIDTALKGFEDGTTTVGNANKLGGLTAEEVGASGARNLIPYPHLYTNRTQGGIEWVDDGDGTVSAKGANTLGSQNLFNCRGRLSDNNALILKAGTYTISGCPSGGSGSLWYIQVGRTLNGSYNSLAMDYGNGATFTLTEDYKPVKWTLKFTSTEAGATAQTVASGNLDAINNYLTGTLSGEYDVEDDSFDEINGNYELSWEWVFDGVNDAADTYMGQIAAGVVTTEPTGYEGDESFAFTLVVEQID